MSPAYQKAITRAEADLIALLPEVEDFLKRRSASVRATSRVLIILEEMILNLIKHATVSATPDINVRLEVAPDRIRIEITDDSAPFDPRSAPEFDKTKPLEERRPGGMGIQIVRSLVNEAHYERRADRNYLVLGVTNP
jgi:serine/threonine-protein kinase RsbW